MLRNILYLNSGFARRSISRNYVKNAQKIAKYLQTFIEKMHIMSSFNKSKEIVVDRLRTQACFVFLMVGIPIFSFFIQNLRGHHVVVSSTGRFVKSVGISVDFCVVVGGAVVVFGLGLGFGFPGIFNFSTTIILLLNYCM